MAIAVSQAHQGPLHPVHAVLLSGTATLFLATLLADAAYAATYEVQWKNFSSWLIVGGLVLGGVTLVAAVLALLHRGRRGRRRLVYFVLLLGAWLLGFINALVHAKDAWASMPEAIVLSAVVAALALLATAIAFSPVRSADLP